jgi:hypothetical protein
MRQDQTWDKQDVHRVQPTDEVGPWELTTEDEETQVGADQWDREHDALRDP